MAITRSHSEGQIATPSACGVRLAMTVGSVCLAVEVPACAGKTEEGGNDMGKAGMTGCGNDMGKAGMTGCGNGKV